MLVATIWCRDVSDLKVESDGGNEHARHVEK